MLRSHCVQLARPVRGKGCAHSILCQEYGFLACLADTGGFGGSRMSNPSSGNSPLLGHLSLEQQRKRAKELLKDYRRLVLAALKRFQAHHPAAKSLRTFDAQVFSPTLSDAQLVIARENGLSSWPRLKAHIAGMSLAAQAIASGSPVALDADIPTLHLRCGSDIQQGLKIAGFCGDFLEFADPYCQGPVPSDAQFSTFLEQRITFIAHAYDITPHDARQRLTHEYARLRQSPDYPRVVLWFEHDAYDQLILAYVLHQYHQTQAPKQLDLICVNRFPGVERFVGLGQLSPTGLRFLWETRYPITPTHLALGEAVWQGLTASSPTALVNLMQTGTPAMATMAVALRRHLQELPWLEDGLGLTERLTLQILSGQASLAAGQVFAELTQRREPLPYLGDTMYWQILRDLSQGPHPLVLILPTSLHKPWPPRSLRLTDWGRAIVKGQAHRLHESVIDRWVCGGKLQSGQPLWCWDEAGDRAVIQNKGIGNRE